MLGSEGYSPWGFPPAARTGTRLAPVWAAAGLCRPKNVRTQERGTSHIGVAILPDAVKSYFLEGISSIERAAEELSRLLPGYGDSWFLEDAEGDTIGYFYVTITEEEPAEFCVQVDLSGRHYRDDISVLSILRLLQRSLGGTLRNDNDEVIA